MNTLEENHLADCRTVHAQLAKIATARGALDASEAELLVVAEELQIWRAYGAAEPRGVSRSAS
jgi:hypothetical protein